MIIIVGGGIIGLVLATALGRARFPVTLIEHRPPDVQWPENSLDSRVSAINQASQQILSHLDIWQKLPPGSAVPLRGLTVWDAQGGGEIDFDSAEIGEPQLGFIIENRVLIKILWENLAFLDTVTLLSPAQPLKVIHSSSHVQLVLTDHTRLSAQLIIGADGGRSWVREEMGVRLQERSYEQHALITLAHSVRYHQQRGWQSFLPTGPLGVLPLKDNQMTAIVWSNTLAQAERLMHLSSTDFNKELSGALNYRLGEMSCLTPPKKIPLVMRHAHDYVQLRFALVGDAAHTIHPLAGQGVNLGLLDAAALVQVMTEARQKQQDIGSLKVLRRYQRWRKGDNLMMLAAMSAFKELFSQNSPWIINLRSHGLNLTDRTSWFKNLIMRYAIGSHGDVPFLAKK